MMTVDELVRREGLAAHPEGGWYREVYRDAAVSTIHYVMEAGSLAPLHRVRGRVEQHVCTTLGPDSPLVVVPPGAWQATRAGDGVAWCGATVAPAFELAAWEMPARPELERMLPRALHAIIAQLTHP